MSKITGIAIRSYRGIEALNVKPKDGATVAQGGNKAGKTSFLRAIRAALLARDVSADAIRHGADAAEILIDMDDVTVRRAITKKGTSLTVSRGDFTAQKPQHLLKELLGGCPIDPLDMLLLPAKERRARVLEALPCTVTEEQLLKYVPKLPPNLDLSKHGLEVLESVRKAYYDKRTEANAKAKESDGAARRAREALGAVVVAADAPTVDAATAALEKAKADSQRLELRADEAAQQERRQKKARDTIEAKKKAAEELRANAPPAVDQAPLVTEGEKLLAQKEQLLSQLMTLENAIAETSAAVTNAVTQNGKRTRALATADSEEAAAIELAEVLHEGALTPPTEEELAAAKETLIQAGIGIAQAKGAEATRLELLKVERLEMDARKDVEAAAVLDTIVRGLTDDAPKTIAETEAIPGLTLEGDDVALDGVFLDTLSGAEQMKLCVEIAKRAAGKGRFLVVDKLEALDEDAFEAFVKEATRGGWQLFGSRVTPRGELQLVHIDPEEETTDA